MALSEQTKLMLQAALNDSTAYTEIKAILERTDLLVGSTTISEAEIGVLDGVTAGTGAASKALVLDSSGNISLPGNLKWKAITTPVAAAGSTVADAGQLGVGSVAHITSDGATKGVKLRTGVLGDFQFVINNSATACELYAASGGTVNGLSADASVVIAASKGVLCFCTAANTWIVFDLTAKATAS